VAAVGSRSMVGLYMIQRVFLEGTPKTPSCCRQQDWSQSNQLIKIIASQGGDSGSGDQQPSGAGGRGDGMRQDHASAPVSARTCLG